MEILGPAYKQRHSSLSLEYKYLLCVQNSNLHSVKALMHVYDHS